MGEFPSHVFVIHDLETLKAVSDPLRLRLFGLLQGEARTVKVLAKELGVAPTRLYYHINQLEELGLVRVAETNLVGGIIEKQYQAAVARITVDRGLLTPGAAPVDGVLETMLSAILDGVREAVRGSVRAGLIDPTLETPEERGLLLGRKWLRLSPEDAVSLYHALIALLSEYAERSTEATADALPYEIVVGLYPVTNPPEENQESPKDE
jgi:DNA-binding transcriptional ArsR family regulator